MEAVGTQLDQNEQQLLFCLGAGPPVAAHKNKHALISQAHDAPFAHGPVANERLQRRLAGNANGAGAGGESQEENHLIVGENH